MMDNDEVISTLNDLIETCKDGEAGFRDCAEHVSDPKLKLLFQDRARDCALAAEELQDKVRACGGNPETRTSLSGTLHRRWVDIKATILGHSDEAILNECERGEDVAVRSYAKATDKQLPPEIRALVERQYQGVVQNHDQIRALRNQVRANS